MERGLHNKYGENDKIRAAESRHRENRSSNDTK